MTCTVHRVPAAEIDELMRDPANASRLLGLDEGPPVREVRPKGILGFLLRLTPITISEVDPDAPETGRRAGDPEKSLDVDRLRVFVNRAADAGDGLVIDIS